MKQFALSSPGEEPKLKDALKHASLHPVLFEGIRTLLSAEKTAAGTTFDQRAPARFEIRESQRGTCWQVLGAKSDLWKGDPTGHCTGHGHI